MTRLQRVISILTLSCVVASLAACGGGGSGDSGSTPPPAESPQPSVTQIAPSSGPPGTTVTIQGVNLGVRAADNTVKINGTTASVLSASSTTLVVAVPDGASTGKLTITTGGWLLTTNDDFVVSAAAPSVTGFSPDNGVAGAQITLSGSGFGTSTDQVSVWVNGTAVPVSAVTPTTLTFSIPPTATSGTIAVQTAGGRSSSSQPLQVLPTISAFTPASGYPGQTVTITGTNLDAHGVVYFWNGVGARIQSGTTDSLSVVIPNGATTGQIMAGGSADGMLGRSAANFTVTSQYVPTVTSFTPTYGVAGSTVTVFGNNFDPTASNNVVKFSGVRATVNLVSAYSNPPFIVVTVPTVGGTGPISVTTPQGTGTSVASYSYSDTPPPPPPGSLVTASPAALSVGAVTVGDVSDNDITLTNTGTTTVHVSGASVQGSRFNFLGTSCYGYDYQLVFHDTLAPGATCKMSVRYSPAAIASDTGTLSFAVGGANPTIALSGSGVAPLVPVATFGSPSLMFGSLELGSTSVPKTVSLTNTGTAPLHITALDVSGEFTQTNDCPATLAVNARCNVAVRFAPRVLTGGKAGQLALVSDASNGIVAIPLLGTGSLAHSGQLAIYTRAPWGVDAVFIDGAWAGGNLRYDSQNTCGGLGAITLTLAPGPHVIDAYDNILDIRSATETVVENGCTVHQVVGTSTCVAPNFISGGYCYPPSPPTCVAPAVLQNGSCVTPGAASGGAGSGNAGGSSAGAGSSGSDSMPAPFDPSGGGTNANTCLTFGVLTGEAADYNDSQIVTNNCSFPVYIMFCHAPSSAPGTASTQCGARGRFFQQFGWIDPGAHNGNNYNMPLGATIWYGSCSGGNLPVGKEVSPDGHYICK